MNGEKIIILGFGRSGTTWLSDIISKLLGGIILFEPFHPEVCKKAKELCYHNGGDVDLVNYAHQEITKFLNKENRSRWLLRNHLSTSIEEVNEHFVKEIWDNCNVLGYKSIRQNLMIPYLYNNVSTRIIFLKRDILSVIASLMRRKRFWMEFGFDFHETKFFREVIKTEKYDYLDKNQLLSMYSNLKDDYLKMAFIWVVTHCIVEKDMKAINTPIFNYEDLYLRPYETTETIAKFIGEENCKIHPSYLFTPSMLTLRTFHKDDDFSLNKKSGLDIFWKDTINKEMSNAILRMQDKIQVHALS